MYEYIYIYNITENNSFIKWCIHLKGKNTIKNMIIFKFVDRSKEVKKSEEESRFILLFFIYSYYSVIFPEVANKLFLFQVDYHKDI